MDGDIVRRQAKGAVIISCLYRIVDVVGNSEGKTAFVHRDARRWRSKSKKNRDVDPGGSSGIIIRFGDPCKLEPDGWMEWPVTWAAPGQDKEKLV